MKMKLTGLMLRTAPDKKKKKRKKHKHKHKHRQQDKQDEAPPASKSDDNQPAEKVPKLSMEKFQFPPSFRATESDSESSSAEFEVI